MLGSEFAVRGSGIKVVGFELTRLLGNLWLRIQNIDFVIIE